MALELDLLGRQEHPGPPPPRTRLVCLHKNPFLSWMWLQSRDDHGKVTVIEGRKPQKRFAFECPDCGTWQCKSVGPRGSTCAGEKRCFEILGVRPEQAVQRDEVKREAATRNFANANNWHYQEESDAWFSWYNRYLESAAWRRLRSQIMKRDNSSCTKCGSPGEQVHHLTYERVGYELPADLVTLCGACHLEAHR